MSSVFREPDCGKLGLTVADITTAQILPTIQPRRRGSRGRNRWAALLGHNQHWPYTLVMFSQDE
jgi:hypothetical protein